VSKYARAAELAGADGYPGLAGIFLAYGVQCSLLGHIGIEDVTPRAEEAVALVRQSGRPGAIVLSLNVFALALVEPNPARAREVLRESMELATTPGQEISSGILTACLVAGRLRDWELALALTRQAMSLRRWGVALRGYAASGHARPATDGSTQAGAASLAPATISFSPRYARPANWWRPRSAMTSEARSAPQVRP